MSAIFNAQVLQTTMQRPIGTIWGIGAPASVIWLKETKKIFNALQLPIHQLQHSRHSFRFADAIYTSIERASLPLEKLPGIPVISVYFDIVWAYIIVLLGMDTLESESLTLFPVSSRLMNRVPVPMVHYETFHFDEGHIPIMRSSGKNIHMPIKKQLADIFSRAIS